MKWPAPKGAGLFREVRAGREGPFRRRGGIVKAAGSDEPLAAAGGAAGEFPAETTVAAAEERIAKGIAPFRHLTAPAADRAGHLSAALAPVAAPLHGRLGRFAWGQVGHGRFVCRWVSVRA